MKRNIDRHCFSLFILGFWFLSGSMQMASAQPSTPLFISLDQYVSRNVMTDGNNLLYVVERCQALTGYTLAIFSNSTHNSSGQMIATLSGELERLAMISVRLMGDSATDNHRQLSIRRVTTMMGIYRDYLDNLQIRGTNLENIPFFMSDYGFCTRLGRR